MTHDKALEVLHGLRPKGSIIPQQRAEMIDIADEAIRKQMPIKPMYFGNEAYLCPTCHRNNFYYGTPKLIKTAYCADCGQAIDWSDWE